MNNDKLALISFKILLEEIDLRSDKLSFCMCFGKYYKIYNGILSWIEQRKYLAMTFDSHYI